MKRKDNHYIILITFFLVILYPNLHAGSYPTYYFNKWHIADLVKTNEKIYIFGNYGSFEYNISKNNWKQVDTEPNYRRRFRGQSIQFFNDKLKIELNQNQKITIYEVDNKVTNNILQHIIKIPDKYRAVGVKYNKLFIHYFDNDIIFFSYGHLDERYLTYLLCFYSINNKKLDYYYATEITSKHFYSISKAISLIKADTIAIVDVFLKAFSFFRSFSDIITIADQARLGYPVRKAIAIGRMTIKRIASARLHYKKIKEVDV